MTQKMITRVHWAVVVVCAICGLGICPNLHADAFADAERSAKEFMAYCEDFRKLDLDLTLRLVQAISEADDTAPLRSPPVQRARHHTGSTMSSPRLRSAKTRPSSCLRMCARTRRSGKSLVTWIA